MYYCIHVPSHGDFIFNFSDVGRSSTCKLPGCNEHRYMYVAGDFCGTKHAKVYEELYGNGKSMASGSIGAITFYDRGSRTTNLLISTMHLSLWRINRGQHLSTTFRLRNLLAHHMWRKLESFPLPEKPFR